MPARGEYLTDIVNALHVAHPLVEKVTVGQWEVKIDGTFHRFEHDRLNNSISDLRPDALRYGPGVIENLLKAAYYTAVDIPEVAMLRLRDGLLATPWTTYGQAAQDAVAVIRAMAVDGRSVEDSSLPSNGQRPTIIVRSVLYLKTPWGGRDAASININFNVFGSPRLSNTVVPYPLYTLLHIKQISIAISRLQNALTGDTHET